MTDLLPGVLLVVVGLLVLLTWRRIADFFTERQHQQRHKLASQAHARLFQRLNTVGFGLMLIGMGVYDLTQESLLR